MTQPVIPNVVRNPIKNTVIAVAVRNPIISDIRKQNEISHFVRDDATRHSERSEESHKEYRHSERSEESHKEYRHSERSEESYHLRHPQTK